FVLDPALDIPERFQVTLVADSLAAGGETEPQQDRGMQVRIGRRVGLIPYDEDVAAEAGEGREALGRMRPRHHEDPGNGIAVRARGVELLERPLRGVQPVALRLEYDAGAVEGALLGEADDEVALFAPGAEAGGVAGGFDKAGRAPGSACDELDDGI